MENSEIAQITDAFNQLNFNSSLLQLDDTKDSNGNYYLVSYCYEYGIGIEKDEKKAFTYYQKSADMNNSNGMYQVGYCYYLGIGIEIDKQKAYSYYLKSAEAGNSMGIWKTAWCYYFGIGVEKNSDKWLEWIKKKSEHGKCAHCNKDNTQPAWCLSCDPDIETRWTSGHKNIDDCIKTFQLRTLSYEDVIEWIPFDRLLEVKKSVKEDLVLYIQQPGWMTLASSKENNNDFLKELAIYGLTQNTETKEYLMVFQYANKGSLYKYLRNNFCNLKWQTKLEILKNISYELFTLHEFAGYVHSDFHSGNILQSQQDNILSYIADLGLSRKIDEKVLEGDICGVMPYVAPEVLLAIMSEITTGQRPFDGHEFDHKLAFKICKRGLRPEFAPGTPECYIELAKKCMDSDPQKRPSAFEVYHLIKEDWLKKIADSNDDNEIKRQFLEADKLKIIFGYLDLSQDDSAQIKLDITKI
ncbi:kinase-like domain-containing protein [Gigaspora rosea]|uniref:Kinase-like domain-containing protein n=1 Tax=Gigaspora rosea TaxID=44941 RepID=A0A397WAF4_9GLOM|nr:kinase-like domain-containing protein [Gigaspora rosea]